MARSNSPEPPPNAVDPPTPRRQFSVLDWLAVALVATVLIALVGLGSVHGVGMRNALYAYRAELPSLTKIVMGVSGPVLLATPGFVALGSLRLIQSLIGRRVMIALAFALSIAGWGGYLLGTYLPLVEPVTFID